MSDQPKEKPLSPLERVKARQAEQARHRAAKTGSAAPAEEGGKAGGGQSATPKPVRSSANKSGG